MGVQDDIAVVQSIYDGFNAKDLEKVLAAVTDDFVLEDIAQGRTFHGREGFLEWLMPFATAVPDAKTEVTNVIAAGEWIVTEHTGRGTYLGPLATPHGEIAPTGGPHELRFAELFRMRDGKIALMRAYYDSATILRQVGAL
jgi:steroid delta-isomerase-like uncharacterized protein